MRSRRARRPGSGGARFRVLLRAGLVLALSLAIAPVNTLVAAPQAAPEIPIAPAQVFPDTLEGHIDAVLAQPFLVGVQASVSVVDLADDKVLYRRNEEMALNPASNVKVVTTAAALSVLGPEHRWATRLYHRRDALQAGVIEGDLWLRGGGDPQLVTEDLYLLAGDLRARGVRRITGGIVVDASRFDRDELPPGYDQKDELASYRAPSGASSVNFNTFVVRVQPAATVGAPPHAVIEPPVPGIVLASSATTGEGAHDRIRVAIEIDDKGRTKVTLTGAIGVKAGPSGYRYPVADPSRYAGEVLAVVLKQRGIRLGRAKIKTGRIPEDAALIASHHSPPLSVMVRAVNKFSNNFMAEQILKSMAPEGAPATFTAALERVRGFLEDSNVPTQGLVLGNGSGLYDTNRISAATLTRLLALVHRDFRVAGDFSASLAVMGVDGTTRSRLRESTMRRFIRAKTGTLDGVSSLSGYVGAIGRDPIAFAILFNGLRPGDGPLAKDAQNRIAELVARHAAGEPLVVTSTVPAADADAETE
jgi:D-alanyl-D-alanine carboxypeptidase/D-alanyl-D-alanine-endopeptidase (penicillin-binding protein 4)